MEVDDIDVAPMEQPSIVVEVPHLSKLHHCVKDSSPRKFGKFCSILSGKDDLDTIFKCNEDRIRTLFSFNNHNLDYLEYTDPRRLPSLLQTIRMGVQKLELASRKNLFDAAEYSTIRSNICNLLRAITTGIEHSTDTKVTDKYLCLIRALWQPVILTPNLRELYISCYDGGATEFVRGQLLASSAKFHNIHGFLEARWFYLEYLLKKCMANSMDDEKMGQLSLIDTEFEVEYKLFLADIVSICLISYSKAIHDRHTVFELFEQKSAFPCVCFLDVLFVCALLSGFLRQEHHFGKFSDYFNDIMSAIEDDRFPQLIQSLCDRLEVRRLFARLTPQDSVFSKFKTDQLNIFKINCLLRIMKVNSGIESEVIEGVRSTLVAFVKAEPNEEQLRAMLLLMAESFGDDWNTKSDLISIFFDCIYKRINTPFYMHNSRLDSLTVVDSSTRNFLHDIQQSLETDKILSHHSTSFSILIHIIGKTLSKQRLSGQRSLSNKLLGRIFSKFSISKIITLSERGLHNFVLLIVTLACSCDLSDFGNRLMDILLQIQYNKLLPDRQKVLVKGHLSLLMLFVDRKLNFAKHIERLVNQLKENVADQSSLWELLSTSVEVILAEKGHFEDGTHLLIGNWIRPFINGCTENERREFFKAVYCILTQLLKKEGTSEGPKLTKALFEHVLPIIKQFFLKKSYTDNIPQIATKFTALAKGTEGLPTFESLLNFFGDTMRPNLLNGLEYYTSLRGQDIAKVSPEFLVQNWIKFEILSQSLPSEQLDLLRQITLAVPEIHGFVSDNVENIKKVNHGGPAPLLFFKAMFEKYYRMDNYNNKLSLVKTADRYLSNFSKWAVIHVETTNVYRFSASLLKYCAPMLYSKMSHFCIFNQIFGQLVLTQDVMMTKQPSLPFCRNMTLSFPDYCITLTKMNFQQDNNLLEKFNNLVSKWTILLAKADPEMSCARKAYALLCRNGDEETIRLTVKTFSEFFLQSKRVTPENLQIGAQIYKSLYGEVIKLDETKVCAVLIGSLDDILEQISQYDDQVSSKRILLELVKDMLSAERVAMFPGIETSFIESLKKLTEKRKLLHYKNQYFQLLQRLIKINVKLVERFLPCLNEAIVDIESVLGRNNDGGLRVAQENLIRMISANKGII